MTRSLILIIASIMAAICAQASPRELKDSVTINFRQSQARLDSTYMDNAQALGRARQSVDRFHRPDSNFVLVDVSVVGGASPEGTAEINDRLSRQRAERIFDYVSARYELPDSVTTFTFLGRDWDGLRRMVEADPSVPYREEVMSIVRSTAPTDGGECLAELKRLHGGESYRYMYRKLFPALRASTMVLTFGNPLARPAAILPLPMAFVDVDRQWNPEIIPVNMSARRPFYMALKTNMLYDLAAVPNIGAEFYLGKNLSVAGNWMYAWWDTDRTHRYWRIYGGDLGLRWWFGSKAHAKPLTGHHAGILGGVLTYDFEWGGKGYMGGVPGGSLWDRCNWMAGAEYGYSMPVGRRLNIDFSLAVGYLTGQYRVYEPEDRCYVWKETRIRRWFGPIKAEVSLVWLIGRDNVNRKKGGSK